MPGTALAQYGPVGFVNVNEGINGITGGMGGKVVRVNNREDLARYAGDPTPYIIIVEGRMEGNGLNRKKDFIELASNKTIVGVKGAELAVDDTVSHPFENLYAHSLDEASCGFVTDRNSYFGKALSGEFIFAGNVFHGFFCVD